MAELGTDVSVWPWDIDKVGAGQIQCLNSIEQPRFFTSQRCHHIDM